MSKQNKIKSVGLTDSKIKPLDPISLFVPEKKNINVIVYCGYEGIEGLVFASTNEEETKLKMLQLKTEAIKRNEDASKYTEDERDKMFEEISESDKKEDWEKYWSIFSDLKDPDRYCVMSFIDDKFKCTCNELGVEPSKPWLM